MNILYINNQRTLGEYRLNYKKKTSLPIELRILRYNLSFLFLLDEKANHNG